MSAFAVTSATALAYGSDFSYTTCTIPTPCNSIRAIIAQNATAGVGSWSYVFHEWHASAIVGLFSQDLPNKQIDPALSARG